MSRSSRKKGRSPFSSPFALKDSGPTGLFDSVLLRLLRHFPAVGFLTHRDRVFFGATASAVDTQPEVRVG
jgi:hypothetical protein